LEIVPPLSGWNRSNLPIFDCIMTDPEPSRDS
jgi:hypothetical protein